MTVDDWRERLGETGWRNDLVILGTTLFGIYLCYVLVELYLGRPIDGVFGELATVSRFLLLFALVVLALNLHWGYTGLFNIGVAGFMMIGVYTMALVSSPEMGLGLPLVIGITVGVLAAGLAGLLIALPALDVRADYFAIVTLGFAEIVRLTFNSRDLNNWLGDNTMVATGGSRGIDWDSGVQDALIGLLYGTDGSYTPIGLVVYHVANAVGFRRGIVHDWTFNLLLLVSLFGLFWLCVRTGNSPFGRVLKAIREDELVPETLGKDTRVFKLKAFVLGCALMGLAGILWHGRSASVSPSSFEPIVTFYIFVALILGGAGSNTGSVLGGFAFVAVLYEGVPRIPRIINRTLQLIGYDLPSAPSTIDVAVVELVSLNPLYLVAYVTSNIGALQFFLLGVSLIIIIQKRPDGLLGHRSEPAASVDLGRPERTDGEHANVGVEREDEDE